MNNESLRLCLAEMLRVEPDEIPEGAPALPGWLAGRGYIRTTVADPDDFEMAGAFLARFERGWAVLFGAPPGPVFDPDGVVAGQPLEVCVLAPLDLSRHSDPTALGPPARGRVEMIGVASVAGEPLVEVTEATAIADRGLEGDRYVAGAGTFSSPGGTGNALTLVEREALEELARKGIELEPLEARRNLVVSGMDLDALIGKRFRVGEVECYGVRRCEPCAHLERLTQPGVLRGLVHRGGLRTDLLSGGEIRVGDDVVALG